MGPTLQKLKRDSQRCLAHSCELFFYFGVQSLDKSKNHDEFLRTGIETLPGIVCFYRELSDGRLQLAPAVIEPHATRRRIRPTTPIYK
jgi:hypothetical protein